MVITLVKTLSQLMVLFLPADTPEEKILLVVAILIVIWTEIIHAGIGQAHRRAKKN